LGASSEEVLVNWNGWIRQTHRWLSIAFTVTVIANFVAMSQGQPPAWVTYSPLLPLALLLFTGLYLFVLPYATRWRSRPKEKQVI
jgi:cellulose synthase/poly-beta-1,6-N-acetylglucosamine synthase-like glycosyltransferase